MNYIHHKGTVTGDESAQVSAFCNLPEDRMGTELETGAIAPLDAPTWLNTGRTVTAKDHNGVWRQFQQQCLRG